MCICETEVILKGQQSTSTGLELELDYFCSGPCLHGPLQWNVVDSKLPGNHVHAAGSGNL